MFAECTADHKEHEMYEWLINKEKWILSVCYPENVRHLENINCAFLL